MASAETLNHVFAGILAAAAGGCGPVVDDEGGESRDGDVCEGQEWWALEQVQPAQAVDYLELRALSGGSLDTLTVKHGIYTYFYQTVFFGAGSDIAHTNIVVLYHCYSRFDSGS